MKVITKNIDGNRYYRYIDENKKECWFPSITSVQKMKPQPWITKWINNDFGGKTPEYYAYMKITQNVGELIHLNVTNDYIHQFSELKLHQNNPDFLLKEDIHLLSQLYRDNVTIGMIEFNKFKKKHKIIPIEIEKAVFNTEYGFAGRLDFLGTYKGKRIIMDIKTSKRIYDSVGVQLEAYNQCLKEKVDELYCLRIRAYNDKPTFQFKKMEVDNAFEKFLKLLKKFKEKYK